ncbi:enolase C-terminal domain-like protein [uncultured Hydrogenophaga sp.]|uniref:mandelate racemase/muconate lactonizing enzyme family protein n=1 Tax=uncultured Hydrogenophaga sp. TaxID=199683 RepID=UPI00258924B4|nr:enolase C-terminal domain-like protein [uncultured Hydrogenophaga sp.]
MKITGFEIRPCPQALRDPQWKFSRAVVQLLEGHVLILRDEEGCTGLGYAHAIPAISGTGASVRAGVEFLAPLLVGRDPRDIGALMDECDLRLANHLSSKAAIDMALYDLIARRLGVPVHALLGGRRRDSIRQSRIVAIKSPTEMAAQSLKLVEDGYAQLKLKLSGDTTLDIERIASVRDAVGPTVALTLDPNQAYSAKQMMAAFARIERHGISLIEQPVPASDWAGLALLTRTLPVAIEADESAQTVQDVRRLVEDRVVDVINLKITKLGGLTRFRQAVQLCEAAGVDCRLGAAFGPALLQAFSAHAASSVRTLPHACELAEHLHLLDDPFEPFTVDHGEVRVPIGAGCGIAFEA